MSQQLNRWYYKLGQINFTKQSQQYLSPINLEKYNTPTINDKAAMES
jgi:hypothetical protein